MSISDIKFGTDGWRGVIADDFTYENVALAAASYAAYLKQHGASDRKGVVVGFDTRFGSEDFAAIAAGVLTAAGFNVMLSDRPVPSPCVSYIVNKKGFLGGVMITASHNPAKFNGFKIKGDYGGSAHPAMVADVEKCLAALPAVAPARLSVEESKKSGLLVVEDIKTEYIEAVGALFDLKEAKDLQIVVDPMYGAGSGCMAKILTDAGANPIEIRAERNPAFPGIQPEPNNKNLDMLYRTVIENKADLGLATDGDADRIGACDGNGADIDSHRIFALMLTHLVTNKGYTGKVVKTCSTTALIDKICAKHGLELEVTPVGFKHITDIMLRDRVLMGGEESGGIGIASFLPERDGSLCGLTLAELVAGAGKPAATIIEDLMSEFGGHYYDRDDLHLQPGVKETTVERLKSGELKEIGGRAIEKVETIDGFKFWLAGGGWLMVRPSGTEPVLRVYCESETPEMVRNNLDWTTAWIRGDK